MSFKFGEYVMQSHEYKSSSFLKKQYIKLKSIVWYKSVYLHMLSSCEFWQFKHQWLLLIALAKLKTNIFVYTILW